MALASKASKQASKQASERASVLCPTTAGRDTRRPSTPSPVHIIKCNTPARSGSSTVNTASAQGPSHMASGCPRAMPGYETCDTTAAAHPNRRWAGPPSQRQQGPPPWCSRQRRQRTCWKSGSCSVSTKGPSPCENACTNTLTKGMTTMSAMKLTAVPSSTFCPSVSTCAGRGQGQRSNVGGRVAGELVHGRQPRC